jgi:hypothetical protein
VREAAARAQCTNNLKQIALALHNHADAHSCLPPATVVNPSLVPAERLSWMVPLLPYIEEVNLHKQLDLQRGWEAEGNRAAGKALVRTLVCPAYPKEPAAAGLTTYIGTAGVGPEAAAHLADDSLRGVFGYDRRITLKDVSDGTANTVAIVETTQEVGRWAAGGASTARGLDPGQRPYVAEGGPFGTTHRNPIAVQVTRLPTLANAAMLDGSVRSFPSSMKPQTFEALATIAGGEPADLYDF